MASYFFSLAGSAVNSIKNAAGQTDPKLGAEAMLRAIDLHRTGDVPVTPLEAYVTRFAQAARGRHLSALGTALQQRYPSLPG
jgi:hypothetical protein